MEKAAGNNSGKISGSSKEAGSASRRISAAGAGISGCPGGTSGKETGGRKGMSGLWFHPSSSPGFV